MLAILRAAVQSGEVEGAEDAYVVLNRQRASSGPERSSKVTWETVKRGCACGRDRARSRDPAAFAVRFSKRTQAI